MQKSLNSIGFFVMSIAAIVGCFLIFGLFIRGGVWIADKILPVLLVFATAVFIFNVAVCIPLAFFRRTKEFSGKALFLSSYFYGLLLWLGCLVITFKLWGWLGIIAGLILLGVGIVPIAVIATAVAGLWGLLMHIIVLFLVLWLTKTLGAALLNDCYAFGRPEAFVPPKYKNSDIDVIDVTSVNVDENEDQK